jgi:hypothetical protein
MPLTLRIIFIIAGLAGLVFSLYKLYLALSALQASRGDVPAGGATPPATGHRPPRGSGGRRRLPATAREAIKAAQAARESAKMAQAAAATAVPPLALQGNLLDQLPDDQVATDQAPTPAIDESDDFTAIPQGSAGIVRRTSYGIDPQAHTRLVEAIHRPDGPPADVVTSIDDDEADPSAVTGIPAAAASTVTVVEVPAAAPAILVTPTEPAVLPDKPVDHGVTPEVPTAPITVPGETSAPVPASTDPGPAVVDDAMADEVAPAVTPTPPPIPASVPPAAPRQASQPDPRVGIAPDQPATDPRQVTQYEKDRLLQALGIADDEAPADPQERLHTRELNDILSRLDEALAATFDDADAPADEGTRINAAVAAVSEHDTTREARVIDRDPDADRGHTTTARLEEGTRNKRRLAEIVASSEPGSAPTAPIAATPAPPVKEKPLPEFNVPDWARADTFDDPAEGGEQTDLFNKN